MQATAGKVAELAKTQVLLLDDHAVVRQGTRQMIEPLPAFSVALELTCLNELDAWLEKPDPAVQLCVLDLNLPEGSALSYVPKIKALNPAIKVLIFSAHTEVPYVQRALASGADGFWAKTIEPEVFQQALQHLCYPSNGHHPLVLPKALKEAVLDADNNDPLIDWENLLTPREQETLVYVAQGMTNKQIADHLVVSVKTVDSHVARVMKKLSMKNRSQLTAFAFQNGLV